MNAAHTSVIVCANSTERYLRLIAAIESVRGQHCPPAEIIVVIDHNTDLFARVARCFPDLIVLENAGPPGLSGARNTGTAAARHDIVAFLDDDAEADPDWLDALTVHFGRSDVLGVSGLAQPRWAGGRPRWWPEEFDWVIGCSYRGLPTTAGRVRNVMGCAMALRRQVVNSAGGFDTALGRTNSGAAGCEETELCIRVAERHPRGLFLHEPAARVRHHVPDSRSTFAYFWSRCFAEGASKRLVTRRAGAGAGLASEYTYVTRTLPAGVVRNLARALRGDAWGAFRAAAIGLGLGSTAAGYMSARTRQTTPGGSSDALPSVSPVLPLVIDVSEPPRELAAAPDDAPYQRAWCLVVDRGIPLTKHDVALDGTERTTADVLARLEDPAVHGEHERMTDAPRRRSRGDATVVIATRGRPELLAQCLASIAAGTVVPGSVVVVDNARPDDRTESLVMRYLMEGSEVEYVREDRPGLAHAHNAALRRVRTEIVAFTDDDVEVHRRWFENLTGAFDTDPDTMCATGLIAPRELDTLAQQWVEGQGVYSKGLRPRVFDNEQHRGEDPMFPYAAGAFGSGANMAFRTTFLNSLGGFDGALGTGTVAKGGDDLAVFYDVIRHGGRLTYVPSAIVLHPHHRDYASLRRQVYGYGAGLGAHLTRCVLDEPRAAMTMVRHHRAATARLSTILHPPAGRGLPAYPRELSRAQRTGLVSGPARYLLSRYRTRVGSRRLARS
ncbi:glycosyltransferase [uncultured Dietzia sp.]|uniref:glycosyltransferase n=1 Tax=uncultured Dietzia sp. TaxID=395519 RepID=UPI0026007127|nr:glycosyltransferase [uncultured Dietzia sp.]